MHHATPHARPRSFDQQEKFCFRHPFPKISGCCPSNVCASRSHLTYGFRAHARLSDPNGILPRHRRHSPIRQVGRLKMAKRLSLVSDLLHRGSRSATADDAITLGWKATHAWMVIVRVVRTENDESTNRGRAGILLRAGARLAWMAVCEGSSAGGCRRCVLIRVCHGCLVEYGE